MREGFVNSAPPIMSPCAIFSSTPTCQKLKALSRFAQIEHRRGEQPGSRAVENHLEPGDRQERRRGLSLFHSFRLLASHLNSWPFFVFVFLPFLVVSI